MSEITILEQAPTPGRFATAAAVQVRLGGPPFNGPQVARVEALLEQASSVLAGDVGKTDAWAEQLTPVPSALRTTVVEMVVRVLQNPKGVRSQGRTLGDFSHNESFADTTAELALTPRELKRCRAALSISSTGSARVPSVLDAVRPYLGSTASGISTADEVTSA